MSCITSDNSTCEMGELREYPDTYRCHLAIMKDEDGGFSVLVLNLPGAGSSARTEEEAIARTREAVAGVIESYRDGGGDIPWESPDSYQIPEGAKQKWILVDA